MGRQAVAAESPPLSRHRQQREGGPAAASPTRPNASVPCCNLPHVVSLLQMLEDMQQAQGAGGPLKKKRQRSESQKDAAAAEPTRRCAAPAAAAGGRVVLQRHRAWLLRPYRLLEWPPG